MGQRDRLGYEPRLPNGERFIGTAAPRVMVGDWGRSAEYRAMERKYGPQPAVGPMSRLRIAVTIGLIALLVIGGTLAAVVAAATLRGPIR
jgi:hypothetical protein